MSTPETTTDQTPTCPGCGSSLVPGNGSMKCPQCLSHIPIANPPAMSTNQAPTAGQDGGHSRELVSAILKEADYDVWKSLFVDSCIEDAEEAKETVDRLTRKADKAVADQLAALREENERLKKERDDYFDESRLNRDYIETLGRILGCTSGEDTPERRIKELQAERDQLREEKAELEKDKARLDWLESQRRVSFGDEVMAVHGDGTCDLYSVELDWASAPSVRAAIDSALLAKHATTTQPA